MGRRGGGRDGGRRGRQRERERERERQTETERERERELTFENVYPEISEAEGLGGAALPVHERPCDSCWPLRVHLPCVWHSRCPALQRSASSLACLGV
jgi:hypothetical protein